jgi:hypothetical protein
VAALSRRVGGAKEGGGGGADDGISNDGGGFGGGGIHDSHPVRRDASGVDAKEVILELPDVAGAQGIGELEH